MNEKGLKPSGMFSNKNRSQMKTTGLPAMLGKGEKVFLTIPDSLIRRPVLASFWAP